jgi:hypothetical protein
MALIPDIEDNAVAVAAAAEAVGICMFMLRSICLGLLGTKGGAGASIRNKVKRFKTSGTIPAK